jgi:hypothetical protein
MRLIARALWSYRDFIQGSVMRGSLAKSQYSRQGADTNEVISCCPDSPLA